MKPRRKRRAAAPAVPAADAPILRGDVLWICCDRSVGAAPRKTRTCVVVSNDIANRFGQALTVIPTQAYTQARAERAYMADLRHPRSTLADDRVANASMVMTYDRKRVTARAGRVAPQTLAAIDRALLLHLALARSA